MGRVHSEGSCILIGRVDSERGCTLMGRKGSERGYTTTRAWGKWAVRVFVLK